MLISLSIEERMLKLYTLISILFLILITGCFRANTGNKIEIIFNKDINNLCYQEEFSFITQSTLIMWWTFDNLELSLKD